MKTSVPCSAVCRVACNPKASNFVMEALELGWNVRKNADQYEIWDCRGSDTSNATLQVPNLDAAKRVDTYVVDVNEMLVQEKNV